MKILIVISALGVNYGGPSKCVLELAQAIGSMGINVDIVTTNANNEQKLDVPLCNWILEKYYRIKYFPYWDLGDYKCISFSLTKWLFQHINDYDLVHTNTLFSYPAFPAHLACQVHNVPYIMTPHGMLEPWALNYKSWKKRFFFSLMEKPALNRASAIQMLASKEAINTRNLNLKAPLVIVPNGIRYQDFQCLPDKEIFYEQFPDVRDKSILLFLGRIDPKKGLDLLATAFAKVHSQFPQTHLIIAGPDNIGFMPTARSFFEKASCLNAVTFTGMLTGVMKYAALSAANIYVAPSYSEGFSMSILEGMASGLPSVITTNCNFPEAAKAKAAYVVDINADEIAQALIQCLKAPQQSQVMGNRARQFILENYTWEKIAGNLIEIYQAILHQKPFSQYI